MTFLALVQSVPTRQLSLAEDLRRLGFPVLSNDRITSHRREVFAKLWTTKWGRFWFVAWMLAEMVNFFAINKSRPLLALLVSVAVALFAKDNPAFLAFIACAWIAASIVAVWTETVDVWRFSSYNGAVAKRTSMPEKLRARAVGAMRLYSRDAVKVEWFGHDPFLAVVRPKWILGVEICRIGGCNTGCPGFDEA